MRTTQLSTWHSYRCKHKYPLNSFETVTVWKIMGVFTGKQNYIIGADCVGQRKFKTVSLLRLRHPNEITRCLFGNAKYYTRVNNATIILSQSKHI